MTFHRTLLILISIALALAFVACADSEQAPQGGDSESGGSSSPPGEPQRGGTLTLLGGDPPTLDPALVSDQVSSVYVVEMFSGLVRIGDDLGVEPDIARDWQVTKDGTVYTFDLREDAVFSDGSPITAEDFKWSLERAGRPETESPVAELYLGDIVGMQDVIDGEAEHASGIEVLGDHTLRITIDGPKAYFLAKLTYPTAYVVKQENVEGDSSGSGGSGVWTDQPVTSGPFVLDEYQIGQRLTLARNENYHGREAYLDRVEYNLAGGVPLAMYEAEEIDVAFVGLSDVERVQNPDDPLNADLVEVPPSFIVQYVGFDVTEPPLDDRSFRQALVHAVDKETLAEEVFAGLVRPADGVLPPGFPGFNEDLQPLEYNPERAQRLLEESSYPSLSEREKRIVLTAPGTGTSPGPTLEAVTDQWDRSLGVDVEIQQVEWATYLRDAQRNRL
ncbi:MAG: peptide ABC transporter substrate-binding protein, partial [Chloroflexota bacterium]